MSTSSAVTESTAACAISGDDELPPASGAALRSQASARIATRPLTSRLRYTHAGVRMLRALAAPANPLSGRIRGPDARQVRRGWVRGEWVSVPGVGKTDCALATRCCKPTQSAARVNHPIGQPHLSATVGPGQAHAFQARPSIPESIAASRGVVVSWAGRCNNPATCKEAQQ